MQSIQIFDIPAAGRPHGKPAGDMQSDERQAGSADFGAVLGRKDTAGDAAVPACGDGRCKPLPTGAILPPAPPVEKAAEGPEALPVAEDEQPDDVLVPALAAPVATSDLPVQRTLPPPDDGRTPEVMPKPSNASSPPQWRTGGVMPAEPVPDRASPGANGAGMPLPPPDTHAVTAEPQAPITPGHAALAIRTGPGTPRNDMGAPVVVPGPHPTTAEHARPGAQPIKPDLMTEPARPATEPAVAAAATPPVPPLPRAVAKSDAVDLRFDRLRGAPDPASPPRPQQVETAPAVIAALQQTARDTPAAQVARGAPLVFRTEAEPDERTAQLEHMSSAPLGETRGFSATSVRPGFDMAMPRQVVFQLAEAARQMPDRPIELTLEPEELGRVRMTLSAGDGTMSVVLNVERGETADLLRRHIDMLAQEFRSIGYGDVSFEFSGGEGRDGGGQQDGATQDHPRVGHTEDDRSQRAPLRLTLSDRMDLRL